MAITRGQMKILLFVCSIQMIIGIILLIIFKVLLDKYDFGSSYIRADWWMWWKYGIPYVITAAFGIVEARTRKIGGLYMGLNIISCVVSGCWVADLTTMIKSVGQLENRDRCLSSSDSGDSCYRTQSIQFDYLIGMLVMSVIGGLVCVGGMLLSLYLFDDRTAEHVNGYNTNSVQFLTSNGLTPAPAITTNRGQGHQRPWPGSITAPHNQVNLHHENDARRNQIVHPGYEMAHLQTPASRPTRITNQTMGEQSTPEPLFVNMNPDNPPSYSQQAMGEQSIPQPLLVNMNPDSPPSYSQTVVGDSASGQSNTTDIAQTNDSTTQEMTSAHDEQTSPPLTSTPPLNTTEPAPGQDAAQLPI